MNCLFGSRTVDVFCILEECIELWSQVLDYLPDSLGNLKGVGMDSFVLIMLLQITFGSSAYKIGM